MNKVLTLCLMVALLLPLTLSAQTQQTQSAPFALSVHGGYSWLDGVVGGDLQTGIFGVSAGWMPTMMPLSGTPVNSFCAAATLYSDPVTAPIAWYGSFGFSSAGYQYEDTYGGEGTEAVYIAMIGTRYNAPRVYFKAGVGVGWNEYTSVFTCELTLGVPLFKNY
jgi:opacity protein-like surface antigen